MEVGVGNEVYPEMVDYYQSIYYCHLFGGTGRYKMKAATSCTP